MPCAQTSMGSVGENKRPHFVYNLSDTTVLLQSSSLFKTHLTSIHGTSSVRCSAYEPRQTRLRHQVTSEKRTYPHMTLTLTKKYLRQWRIIHEHSSMDNIWPNKGHRATAATPTPLQHCLLAIVASCPPKTQAPRNVELLASVDPCYACQTACNKICRQYGVRLESAQPNKHQMLKIHLILSS
jgi:hypothetical protein